MKAMVCERFGPIKDLKCLDLPEPVAVAGEVVIRVEAASVNFPDALMVQGLYQVRPPLPFTPGFEVSGTIESLGEGVGAFSAGQRVMAQIPSGAFAQKVRVPASAVMPLPDAMSFDYGAAIGLTYLTSLHALKDIAALKAGETLVILGASGGVGIAAIELGKAMGAQIIACASSPAKLAACRMAGADETVNYAETPLKEALLELTGKDGADVVYDAVGGAHAETALRSLGWRGRYLVVGFATGQIPAIPLNLALLKERQILGVYWGESIRHDPKGHMANVAQLLDWFGAGKVSPIISRAYRLEETIEALTDIAERRVIGKVVIHPQS